jgi:hypothetical protein
MCSVREAVGLSFNLHHKEIGKLNSLTKPTSKRFATRLKTAVLALDVDGGIPTVPGHPAAGESPEEKIVRITDFVNFIQRLGWKNIPDGLVASCQPSLIPASPSLNDDLAATAVPNSAAARHSTPWLKVLNAAIDEFYGPNKSGHRAKKDDVIRWILEQAEKYGATKSQRIAEAIFTIITSPTTNYRRKNGL